MSKRQLTYKTTIAFYMMLLLFGIEAAGLAAPASTEPNDWTIYITNDNCPDYTWGYTEQQTRESFAEIVRAHLDEMNRTDSAEPANRDRYNMAAAQEGLCFIEHYPKRKDELIRRIKEGRIFVSPYLCNSLWAFQSVEGAIRTFYPARRLERDWGIKIDVAEHIEEPSLPWGIASILSGCGIRWLSVPFYSYDSTFGSLKTPALFFFEGPDGAKIRVVMDPYACNKASYMQGGHIVRNPDTLGKEWLPHYTNLGKAYPLRAILASGTHGDIAPHSGSQARGFADAIAQYNVRSGPHPKLINATVRQFCDAVDGVEAQTAFMPTIRGCFGHSWDLWPVSLAKYAAEMRQAERSFLAAETLLSIAALSGPDVCENTRKDREQAEWYWAMLSDHAWNGNSPENKLHNAELRKKWSEQFLSLSHNLRQQAWTALGLKPDKRNITIFNPLSFPRKALVRIEDPPEELGGVLVDGEEINFQVVSEQGKSILYFVCPEIPAFGFKQAKTRLAVQNTVETPTVGVKSTELQSPYYRLTIHPETGGISSLVHKPTETELVASGTGRTLCQTVYFDGEEHALTDVKTQWDADGPVLVRLKITGSTQEIKVTNFVTAYADLDRIDFDIHIDKPVTTKQERLCQVFPVLGEDAELRIETTGAVIRPQPQPDGDLLPGADTRRFAVQGFADLSLPKGFGATIVPLDTFALRLDLDPISFEALGNDQNYREVIQNQHGVRRFRLRYCLRAHRGPYNGAEAFAFSKSAASPPLAVWGMISQAADKSPIELDPTRAIATCLKPADDPLCAGLILRLNETAGMSGLLRIRLNGCKKALLTDLLERDLRELEIADGKVTINLNSHGFASVRLLP